MPVFELQGPDGKTYEVDAPDMGSAAAAFGNFAPPGVGDLSVDNVVRSVARGIPILGGAMDNIAAAGDAATHSVLGRGSNAPTFSERYNQNLATEQGIDAAYDTKHPIASTAGQVTGAVASLLPVAAAAPAWFGVGEAPLWLRTLQSIGTGTGIGGADAAVRSGGDVGETLWGAGFGAAGGLVGPIAGDAIGAGVRKLSEKAQKFFADPSNPITGGITPAALRYAVKTISDPAQRKAFFDEIGRLGDQAMLADVSPEWGAIAEAAATRPGMRDAIIKPLMERDAGKNIRLRQDLDASLGEPVVPSRVDAQIEAGQDALSPQYTEVLAGGEIPNTQGLAYRLDDQEAVLRGKAQKVTRDVRRMLNVPRTDVLDPDPQALLNTRHAIDGMLKTEADPTVIRQLNNMRRQVDEVLADAVPGIKGVDADWAELARQREGLTQGSKVLDGGKTAIRPQEFAEDFADAALPQGEQIGPSAVPMRIQQGVRADIDRVAGLNSNDPAAIQRLVKSEGDWNRAKLRTAFGEERADDALNAIDRETQFYRTKNDVTGNSKTAVRQEFGKLLSDMEKPAALPVEASATGIALRTAQAAVRAGTKSAAEKNAEKFAEQLGKLAVAQGKTRDDILASLQRALEIRQVAGKNADDIRLLINAVTRAGAQEAQQSQPLRITVNAR